MVNPKNSSTDISAPPEVHQEELTQIAKGAGINIIGKVAGSAIQYIFSLVIARILHADAFGIFMLGFTIMSIGGAIGRLGLENGAIKFISQYLCKLYAHELISLILNMWNMMTNEQMRFRKTFSSNTSHLIF